MSTCLYTVIIFCDELCSKLSDHIKKNMPKTSSIVPISNFAVSFYYYLVIKGSVVFDSGIPVYPIPIYTHVLKLPYREDDRTT